MATVIMSPRRLPGTTSFRPPSAPDCRRLPDRIRNYLEAVETCARNGSPVVSLVLFGGVTRGTFSAASDVDLIVVVADDTTPADKRKLRKEIVRLEIQHGFRQVPADPMVTLRARIERAAGHLFPCCVCTQGDLLSGDVARSEERRVGKEWRWRWWPDAS